MSSTLAALDDDPVALPVGDDTACTLFDLITTLTLPDSVQDIPTAVSAEDTIAPPVSDSRSVSGDSDDSDLLLEANPGGSFDCLAEGSPLSFDSQSVTSDDIANAFQPITDLDTLQSLEEASPSAHLLAELQPLELHIETECLGLVVPVETDLPCLLVSESQPLLTAGQSQVSSAASCNSSLPSPVQTHAVQENMVTVELSEVESHRPAVCSSRVEKWVVAETPLELIMPAQSEFLISIEYEGTDSQVAEATSIPSLATPALTESSTNQTITADVTPVTQHSPTMSAILVDAEELSATAAPASLSPVSEIYLSEHCAAYLSPADVWSVKGQLEDVEFASVSPSMVDSLAIAKEMHTILQEGKESETDKQHTAIIVESSLKLHAAEEISTTVLQTMKQHREKEGAPKTSIVQEVISLSSCSDEEPTIASITASSEMVSLDEAPEVKRPVVTMTEYVEEIVPAIEEIITLANNPKHEAPSPANSKATENPLSLLAEVSDTEVTFEIPTLSMVHAVESCSDVGRPAETLSPSAGRRITVTQYEEELYPISEEAVTPARSPRHRTPTSPQDDATSSQTELSDTELALTVPEHSAITPLEFCSESDSTDNSPIRSLVNAHEEPTPHQAIETLTDSMPSPLDDIVSAADDVIAMLERTDEPRFSEEDIPLRQLLTKKVSGMSSAQSADSDAFDGDESSEGEDRDQGKLGCAVYK